MISNITVPVPKVPAHITILVKDHALVIPLAYQTQHCLFLVSEKPTRPTGKPHYIFTTPTETMSRSYIKKLHFKYTLKQYVQSKLICTRQVADSTEAVTYNLIKRDRFIIRKRKQNSGL